MLKINQLVKTYRTDHGDVQAVKSIDLEVADGEVVTLLGPSGCGKTTTLRCIAGLEKPDGGSIEIDGDVVFSGSMRKNIAVHQRPIAMVFQSYAIWPHMSVFENVAYPLKVGKTKFNKREIEERVTRALQTVRIPELASRAATMLSGGQQQRVAVARALVKEPKLLLLDEPLSNLDAKLREEVRLEFKDLFIRTGLSAVYVTHDLLEALVLSNRIAVMNQGIIAQIGTPREVYSQPQDEFVAAFMGAGNVLPGTVKAVTEGRVTVGLGFGDVTIPSALQFDPHAAVSVVIRPDWIQLSSDKPADDSSFPCSVETSAFLGNMMEYRVALSDDQMIRVQASIDQKAFSPGDKVYLRIPPGAAVAFSSQALAGASSPSPSGVGSAN